MRGKDLQRGVIAGLEKLGTHDHVRLAVWVQPLDVVEDLGRTLPSTDNGHPVRSRRVCQELGYFLRILRRMHDSWALRREEFRDGRLAANGEDDVSGLVICHFPGGGITGRDGEGLEGSALLGRSHGENLVLVLDEVVKVASAPAQVVFILDAGRKESIEVGEFDQPVILVEVVEKCEVRSGVAQRGHILDE